jgi:preprotein translocase subunit SecY
MQAMASWFSIDSAIYWFFYGLLIVFFTYFYTAIIFNPIDLADNMRKQGGFIPGIRPGKKTSDHIDEILTRITLPGAIFLALIAIFPYFIVKVMHISYGFSDFFGGTGLLIVVGVALDTLQQIESQLLIRHYDGFLKKGRLKGRRGL